MPNAPKVFVKTNPSVVFGNSGIIPSPSYLKYSTHWLVSAKTLKLKLKKDINKSLLAVLSFWKLYTSF